MATAYGGGTYNDSDFWKVLKKVGAKVVQPALELYYVAGSANTPTWAKAIALGALGYLIMPLDGVADVVPLIGFGDDVLTMSVALGSLGRYVDADIKRKAEARAKEVLGF